MVGTTETEIKKLTKGVLQSGVALAVLLKVSFKASAIQSGSDFWRCLKIC